MNSNPLKLVLADDDEDDCLLFKEALEEIPIQTSLSVVNNGEKLIQLLKVITDQIPAVLFLDLNMPRKNGYECLVEIRKNEKYKTFPVIIYSTSFDDKTVERLYISGAQYFIRKPTEFSKLKQVIYEALMLVMQPVNMRTEKEKFILYV